MKGVGLVAGGAALVGVVALGKGLKDGVTAAGNFQQQLNVLQSVTGGTTAELSKASQVAIKLGADVHLPAVSAGDAAAAMLELGKAGFSMSQSITAARGTLLLATAAQTDTATAAKSVTQNINAFGLKAKDTNKIVDQMAGFMNTTGTSFDAFSDSLTYVAAPAHTVGQNFKDTAAQLAILSKNGIEGSMAGTGLRQVLVRLGSTTGKAHDALKAIGVETKGADGNFIGIRATIEKLHPVLDKMTSADRLTLMKEAFGQTAMNQANILLGTLPGKYDAVAASIGKQGQANDLAASRMKGFNGATAALGSSIETLEIQIGLKLLPVLTELVNWLSKELPVAVAFVTQVITGLSATYDAHRAQVQTVFAAVKSAISSTFDFVTHTLIPAAIQAWDQYGPAIKRALETAAAAVSTAIGAIKVAIDFVRTTVIPQAIAAWATYGPKVKQVFDDVVTILKSAAALIKGVISQIQQNWDAIWSVIGPTVKAAFEVVRTVVVAQIKIVSGVIHGFAALLRGDWGEAWGALKGIVATELGAVVSVVGSILHGLVGTAEGLAKLVGKGIAAGIKAVATYLEGLAGDMWAKIKGAISQVAGQAYTGALAIGKQIAAGALKGVEGLPGKLLAAITPFGGGGGGTTGKVPQVPGGSSSGSGSGGGGGGGDGKTYGTNLASAVILGFVTKISELGPKASDATLKSLKTSFDAAIQHLQTTLQAQLTAAQTKIDAFKAKLTPTEALQASLQAAAALASVQSSYSQAEALLTGLKAKQDATWAQLLADQATNLAAMKAAQDANIAAMRAAQQPQQMDADIAKHEFDKGADANKDDPIAVQLVNADKYLRMIKQNYAQGSVSLDQLLAAQDAYDAATLAAADDTNAQKVDADYQNWQALGLQATQGAQAIAAQQATDAAAVLAQQTTDQADQQTLLATFHQEKLDAETNFGNAKQGLLDYYITQEATNERNHTNTMATELNSALVTRFNRIKTHLDNVHTETDTALGKLETMAGKSGAKITENLANAIGDAADPNGPLETNLKKVAKLIEKYLKTNSPTELGPMRDLDKWMVGFAPAYLKGLDSKLITDTIGSAVDARRRVAGAAGAPAQVIASAAPSGRGYGRGGDTYHIYQQPGESTDALLQRMHLQLRTG